ncbi:MAG: M1 family metallopeptidase [Myxococcota bacterium]
MPPRTWDFVHLDLRVRVDLDARRVDGVATHTVRRLGDAGVVQLHQIGLAIDAVEVDGAPAAWRVAGGWLEVPVAADPAPTGSDASAVDHTVTVRYNAEPQAGLQFRGGPDAPARERREAWSQGEPMENRHWFPGWDYPNDKFTVDVTVEAPPGTIGLANGLTAGPTPLAGGWTAWAYHLDRPIANYLVAIAVGDYTTAVDEADGPVRFEYVGGASVTDATLRRTFARATAQRAYFEALLGEPFPYPVYRQLAVQGFQYGGMENAGFTIVNDRRLLGPAEFSEERTDQIVAHELAHQWFGDLLTCYGWRELWLNEGFAEYYAARWQAHDQGEPRGAELVQRWLERSLATRDQPMAPRGATKVGDAENAGVYVRGAAVLHMLRVHLGDAGFDAAIRRYVQTHRDGLVESDQLRRALEEVSGEHLGWLFDQWVTGAGLPSWSSRHRWSDGRLEVTFDQTTPSTIPPFSAPVEVEIGLADGTARVETAWLGAGRTALAVPLDAPPRYVAVDPRGGVLADWDRQQTAAEWTAQATTADAPFARLVGIGTLGRGIGDAPSNAALIAILNDAAAPLPYRRAAAEALGAATDAGVVEALIAATDRDPVDLAVAATSALGRIELDDLKPAAAAVRRLARSDRPVEVRTAAIASLAHLDPEAARVIARGWLVAPDPSAFEAYHAAAAEALGQVGGITDRRLLRSRIDERRSSSWTVAAAGTAAVRLAVEAADGDAVDDERVALARAIEPLLGSRNIRVRQAAIGWLGKVGDERSERALTAFASHNRVEWSDLSEAARDAAQLVRVKVEPEAAPTDADLERVREELAALERRLEELETWH